MHVCRFHLTAHEPTAGNENPTTAAASASDRHRYREEEVLWDHMGEVKDSPRQAALLMAGLLSSIR